MRKIILILFLISIVSLSNAQSAREILEKYINATAISNHTNQTIVMSLVLDIQGTDMSMKTYVSADKRRSRYVMDFQGNEMAFVVNGNDGWVETGDNVQEIPKEFITQSKFLSFFASIMDIVNDYDLSSDGETDINGVRYYVVSLVSKENKDTKYVLYVNKLTNLVEYVNVLDKEFKSDLYVSDYKNIDGALLPSSISVQTVGQSLFTIFVENVSFGVKIPEWYYERPN